MLQVLVLPRRNWLPKKERTENQGPMPPTVLIRKLTYLLHPPEKDGWPCARPSEVEGRRASDRVELLWWGALVANVLSDIFWAGGTFANTSVFKCKTFFYTTSFFENVIWAMEALLTRAPSHSLCLSGYW